MPPFDGLTTFLKATNENTAALVSAKVDFTLFRFDAPLEYSSIGPALSTTRRSDAEHGPVHRTARRLAALFEQHIPNTPKLVAAYGKRVSSIIVRPDVNPKGSANDGPFQPYVGADGTAVWAAATSGPGGVGIYLLACFLARLWDHTYAISIWVELIESRRAEIKADFGKGGTVPESALMSTFQDISRDDLAIWDSSARSWLQTAERVKHVKWQLTQLDLVTKDLGLPFSTGSTTYAKVLTSWTKAMKGIEDLLDGMPQQISDASILAAFSSWHLFPDLIVLSRSAIKISFRDELFSERAIGTIGLRTRQLDNDTGIQWSLVLSHLQYYGSPVEATTYASQPKIDFLKLRLASLGCLFAKWDLHQSEYLEAAELLTTLWEILLNAPLSLKNGALKDDFGWLYIFVQASNDLLLAQSNSTPTFEDYMRVVSYGVRRGQSFLGSEEQLPTCFGLRDNAVLMALSTTSELDASISYLRSVAEDFGLRYCDGVITCAHWRYRMSQTSKPDFYEYSPLTNQEFRSKKRKADEDGESRTEFPHWFLEQNLPLPENVELNARIAYLRSTGVTSVTIPFNSWYYSESGNTLLWRQVPAIFLDQGSSDRSDDPSSDPSLWRPGTTNESFTIVEGSYWCGLAVKLKHSTSFRWNRPSSATVSIRNAIKRLKHFGNQELIWGYMCSIMRNSWKSDALDDDFTTMPRDDIGIAFVAKRFAFPKRTCNALHALSVADMVFQSIEVPTISLECLELSLSEVPWFDGVRQWSPIPKFQAPRPKRPTRSGSFSCICYLDSGNISLEPQELAAVFAMCCNNSIYVTGTVVTDPTARVPSYETRHIVGNVGHGGISMLFGPQDPLVRKCSYDYQAINHRLYDFKHVDNFRDTTLHLSFTNRVFGMADRGLRTIDHEVHFVESVISVRESGRWVADLDILSIDFRDLVIANATQATKDTCLCEQDSTDEWRSMQNIRCIDSWDELLDKPKASCIVRAHGNWAARLAATSILCQQGQGHAVCLFDGPDVCVYCQIKEREDVGRKGLKSGEANIAQFCID